MPTYEHYCGECDTTWEVEYSVADYDKQKNRPCLVCKVPTHRLVGGTGFILNGPGWARDGYSKTTAWDSYKKEGRKVEFFDSKEDHDRVVKGEAEEAEKRKLKRLNEVSKRVFGPDAAVKASEAEKKIRKAGEKRLKS